MALVSTQLGSLSCRVFQQSSAAPRLVVILCHGFGASGEDLVPLGAELVRRQPALDQVRFVFPAAPLSLGEMGPGWGNARAWWPLDVGRLMARRAESASEALRAELPEGLAPARRALMSLVNELTRTTGLPTHKLVLGGFSQGAMLATDVALRLEEPPAALVILSGTLLAEHDWAARASSRKGLRVFQSHGRQDPILPFGNAERLRDVLNTAGLRVDFLPFEGEHTIPEVALERLAQTLAELLVV